MKICRSCGDCFSDDLRSCSKDGTRLESALVASKDSIEDYSLDRLVQRCSSAETYLAQNLRHRRSLLITVAKLDPERESDFLSDLKVASTIFHSGLSGVYDSGTLDGGLVFGVSESCEGRTLREILIDGPPELSESIRIVRETAEAVHSLHTSNLVHGALRPENIVLQKSGDGPLIRLKNADFGQVFVSDIVSDRLGFDQHRDSIRYLAPELFNGGPVSPLSDVYSLGILLFELLTGAPPFDSPDASEVVQMHLDHRPPDIHVDSIDLRMLLSHTVTEALQKRPSFRQQTADLFARQMRHIEQLATHTSTPAPAGHVNQDPPARHLPTSGRAAASATRTQETSDHPKGLVRRTVDGERANAGQEPLARALRPTQSKPATPKRSRLESVRQKLDTLLNRKHDDETSPLAAAMIDRKGESVIGQSDSSRALASNKFSGIETRGVETPSSLTAHDRRIQSVPGGHFRIKLPGFISTRLPEGKIIVASAALAACLLIAGIIGVRWLSSDAPIVLTPPTASPAERSPALPTYTNTEKVQVPDQSVMNPTTDKPTEISVAPKLVSRPAKEPRLSKKQMPKANVSDAESSAGVRAFDAAAPTTIVITPNDGRPRIEVIRGTSGDSEAVAAATTGKTTRTKKSDGTRPRVVDIP